MRQFQAPLLGLDWKEELLIPEGVFVCWFGFWFLGFIFVFNLFFLIKFNLFIFYTAGSY